MRFRDQLKKLELLIPRRNRIAYLGWLGYNNLGDEILFEAHKKLFGEYCLQERPPSKFLDKIEARLNIIQFNSIFLGGGTLIYKSNTYLELLNFYRYKKGLKLFCIGTGVLNSCFWEKQEKITWMDKSSIDKSSGWNEILKRFSKIGVRGPISQGILKTAGIKNVEVVGDTALALAKDDYKKKSRNNIIGINLGISNGIMWGCEQEFINKIEKLIKRLIKEDYKVILLPVWDKDMPINKKIFNKINHPNLLLKDYINNFQKYYSTVENCDIFIGEKLHSVIISTMTRTPSIMLEYRPKCIDFMSSMELEKYNLRTDSFELNVVLNMINELYVNTDLLQKQIDQKIKYYKNKLMNFAEEIRNEINKK